MCSASLRGKGERLVLLTTRNLNRETLRAALRAACQTSGFHGYLMVLEKLPTLASGKLDLAECRRLATVQLCRSYETPPLLAATTLPD